MSRLQTMGTMSCATFAIGWFKKQEQWNDEYLADKEKFRKNFSYKGEHNAADFYSQVILPIAQPLGRSADMPFDMLMDEVDEHSKLEGKFIIVTLNEDQIQAGYWPERLKARGFEAIDRTNNEVGQPCTIYTRSRRRMPMPGEEEYEEYNPFEDEGYDEDCDCEECQGELIA